MTTLHMPAPYMAEHYRPRRDWRTHPLVQQALTLATPGMGILSAIAAFGLGIMAYRFWFGLGSSTNLKDQFPWGMWIGVDVLTGVAICGGAFSLAAVVEIFHFRKYHPLVRPAILTAFLGYSMVILALLADLGRWYNIWHIMIMWNPRSILFEVGWCVMLYTTVLLLEFSPAVFERLNLQFALRIMRKVLIPLVIAGIMFSTLHQSSLGGLYLITATKMDPLWFTAWLPVLFWLSAIGGGLSMVIVEGSLSARAFRRRPEVELLGGVAKMSGTVLLVYFGFKLWDVWQRGALSSAFEQRPAAILWLLEMAAVLVPALLLWSPQVRRSANGLFAVGAMAVGGLILNRVNICLTAMWVAAGTSYVPSWMEFGVTAGIIALGVVAFRVIATFLPVFEEEHGHEEAVEPVPQTPPEPPPAARWEEPRHPHRDHRHPVLRPVPVPVHHGHDHGSFHRRPY